MNGIINIGSYLVVGGWLMFMAGGQPSVARAEEVQQTLSLVSHPVPSNVPRQLVTPVRATSAHELLPPQTFYEPPYSGSSVVVIGPHGSSVNEVLYRNGPSPYIYYPPAGSPPVAIAPSVMPTASDYGYDSPPPVDYSAQDYSTPVQPVYPVVYAPDVGIVTGPNSLNSSGDRSRRDLDHHRDEVQSASHSTAPIASPAPVSITPAAAAQTARAASVAQIATQHYNAAQAVIPAPSSTDAHAATGESSSSAGKR